MTYAEILAAVKLMFGGTTAAEVSFPTAQGELQSCIQAALDKVAERIDPSFETYMVPRTATITGDGTTTEWDIPTLITSSYRFLRAKQVVIGTNIVTHARFKTVLAVGSDSDELDDADYPVVALAGQKLHIFPALTAGTTATLYYLAYPSQTLVNDSGTGSLASLTWTDALERYWVTNEKAGQTFTDKNGLTRTVSSNTSKALVLSSGGVADGAYTLTAAAYTPNVGVVPAPYHEAIGIYAAYLAGFKVDGPNRWDPNEMLQRYERSFMLADMGQNEGFSDKTDTMKDCYAAKFDDVL